MTPLSTRVAGATVKLTRFQQDALRWLGEQHAKFPENDYGFNPTYHARHAAVCRRTLAGLGLVRLNRLSSHHIRYSLTEAGRLALSLSQDSPI